LEENSMAVVETANVAELIAHLGVPPERIRTKPPPGWATEEDVIVTRPLCELIDGILVEKAMGFYESRLAVVLAYYLETYLETNDIGFTLGEGGMMRLQLGQVRIPDVAFYSWDHFPNRILSLEQILDQVPDLAVEVLSPSNTAKEMERKLREYFAGGARLVWYVEAEKRTVDVYTSVDQVTTLEESQSLDGGEVLPGFNLSIKDWFNRAGQRGK
jgi:Uma2 family endonuclease